MSTEEKKQLLPEHGQVVREHAHDIAALRRDGPRRGQDIQALSDSSRHGLMPTVTSRSIESLRVTTLVEQGLSSGLILPTQREEMMARGNQDPVDLEWFLHETAQAYGVQATILGKEHPLSSTKPADKTVAGLHMDLLTAQALKGGTWNESKHPRGQKGNSGQFTETELSSSAIAGMDVEDITTRLEKTGAKMRTALQSSPDGEAKRKNYAALFQERSRRIRMTQSILPSFCESIKGALQKEYHSAGSPVVVDHVAADPADESGHFAVHADVTTPGTFVDGHARVELGYLDADGKLHPAMHSPLARAPQQPAPVATGPSATALVLPKPPVASAAMVHSTMDNAYDPADHPQQTPSAPDRKTYKLGRKSSEIGGWHQFENEKRDTECPLVAQGAAGAPATATWVPGVKVRRSDIQPGTVIATFDGKGKYNPDIADEKKGTAKSDPDPTKHTAIYLYQDEKGIYVLDQSNGTNKVNKQFM
jgi:hypothetical protein